MSNIEVIGLGALNIDHICKVEHILEDGETVVKESRLFPGGSAANTIYGLGKLGVSTGFIGAVGPALLVLLAMMPKANYYDRIFRKQE
jgi:sugar/nucleoside kinase (ribokinase family)